MSHHLLKHGIMLVGVPWPGI